MPMVRATGHESQRRGGCLRPRPPDADHDDVGAPLRGGAPRRQGSLAAGQYRNAPTSPSREAAISDSWAAACWVCDAPDEVFCAASW